MHPSTPSVRGVHAVALAALLWSSGGLFIKLLPASGLAVVAGRSLLAALFFIALLRPDLRKARWSTALVYAFTMITFVTATKLTTAANAVFLQYTGPVYVIVLGPWLLGERFRRIDGYCLAVSLIGMTIFALSGLSGGGALGNALGALSGVGFAFLVILLRREARENGDALPSTTLGNLIAVVLVLPFVAGDLRSFASPTSLAILGYLGFVQMGIAYVLFARGLKTTEAASASLVTMLEPVLSPVWVFLGTGERPSTLAMLGGAIVVAAIAVRTIVVMRAATDSVGTLVDSLG